MFLFAIQKAAVFYRRVPFSSAKQLSTTKLMANMAILMRSMNREETQKGMKLQKCSFFSSILLINGKKPQSCRNFKLILP